MAVKQKEAEKVTAKQNKEEEVKDGCLTGCSGGRVGRGGSGKEERR